MFISKRKGSKGKEYVYLVESFRDKDGKPKNRIIKSYGEYEALIKDDPAIIEKLKIQAKELTKQQQENNEIQLTALSEKISKSLIASGEEAGYSLLNVGCLVYKKIWDELNLDDFFQKEQANHSKIKFSLKDAVLLMVLSRLISPSSKYKAFDTKDKYICNLDVDLNHIYRSLDVLLNMKDDVEKHLNKRINKLYKRSVNVAFYDVTTYHFESVISDGLRDFAYSKAAKFNEVQVVMGLFIDDEGIPLGYELYPGNTFDSKTLESALKNLKKKFKIDNVIISADRGINSKANLNLIKNMGCDYIMSSKIKGAKGSVKKEFLSDEGYCDIKDLNHNNVIYKYKVINHIDEVIVDEENKRKETLEENLIVTWSLKRANKDKADRNRLIDKAIKLAESPSQVKALNKRGGKKYLKIESKEESIKLDEKKIQEDSLFDGYYAMQTSRKDLSPSEIVDIYKKLWKIEESFRVMKQQLKTKPIFHWSEPRIKGHFLVCYIAFTIQRVLEYILKKESVKISSETIQEVIKDANVLLFGKNAEGIYLKQKTNPLYDEMIKAIDIIPLKNITTESEMKKHLKKYNLNCR